MEYRRFEQLVIATTAGLVVLGVAASIPTGGATPTEIAAQLAIILVVAVAAHWGRKAGTLVALLTSCVYLALRIPIIANSLTGPAMLLVASRIAGYLLLGIVGGEVFGRVKYAFAGDADEDAIDEFSRVFSERFAARSIRQALSRLDRYEESFSIVLITLDGRAFSDPRADHVRHFVRSVANIIRDDVRIVDDVAHLDDGRFFVLLCRTSPTGAQVVADRLGKAISSGHGVDPESVRVERLSAPADGAVIEALRVRLEGAAVQERD